MSKPPKMAPHVVVKGGLAAIKCYEDVFDADTQFLMMANDDERVMHAVLEINDSIIYLCDDFTGRDAPASNTKTPGKAVIMIHLQLKKPKHVNAMMQQAVEHGAEIVMPADDMFWGDRYGQIRDPFGHVWSFGAKIKDKDKHKKHDTSELEAEPAEAIESHVPEAKPIRKSSTRSRTRGV